MLADRLPNCRPPFCGCDEFQAWVVEVGVHAFNSGARRFYEGFGFQPSIGRLMLAA